MFICQYHRIRVIELSQTRINTNLIKKGIKQTLAWSLHSNHWFWDIQFEICHKYLKLIMTELRFEDFGALIPYTFKSALTM